MLLFSTQSALSFILFTICIGNVLLRMVYRFLGSPITLSTCMQMKVSSCEHSNLQTAVIYRLWKTGWWIWPHKRVPLFERKTTICNDLVSRHVYIRGDEPRFPDKFNIRYSATPSRWHKYGGVPWGAGEKDCNTIMLLLVRVCCLYCSLFTRSFNEDLKTIHNRSELWMSSFRLREMLLSLILDQPMTKIITVLQTMMSTLFEKYSLIVVFPTPLRLAFHWNGRFT